MVESKIGKTNSKLKGGEIYMQIHTQRERKRNISFAFCLSYVTCISHSLRVCICIYLSPPFNSLFVFPILLSISLSLSTPHYLLLFSLYLWEFGFMAHQPLLVIQCQIWFIHMFYKSYIYIYIYIYIYTPRNTLRVRIREKERERNVRKRDRREREIGERERETFKLGVRDWVCEREKVIATLICRDMREPYTVKCIEVRWGDGISGKMREAEREKIGWGNENVERRGMRVCVVVVVVGW